MPEVKVNEKVLIVDDSELDRFFIKKLLEYLGMNADEARNGNECIEAVCENTYSLIFMDYLMPAMTGIQTLSKIRGNTNNKNKKTPLIALVSPDDPDEGKMCLDAGFANYLDKPVDFKQLVAALIIYLPDEAREKIKIPSADGAKADIPTVEPKTEIEAADNSEVTDVIKSIMSISDIDYEKGISLCGSEEGYITAVEIFYNSIDLKADEIENYYNAGDYKNYTIKVHALKSSANLIGALKLWADAKALEDAGNNEDYEKIKKDTGPLLSDYRSFKEKLKFIAGDTSDDKPEVPPDALNDAYTSLSEFIEAMDFDLADMVIKSMKDYKLPDKDDKTFKELEKLLAGLNWDDMKKVMQDR